jgi:hypothetical protein
MCHWGKHRPLYAISRTLWLSRRAAAYRLTAGPLAGCTPSRMDLRPQLGTVAMTDIPPCLHDENGARRWKSTRDADGLGDSRFTQICGREAADGGGAKKLGKDWGSVGDGISVFFSLKFFLVLFYLFSWSCSIRLSATLSPKFPPIPH